MADQRAPKVWPVEQVDAAREAWCAWEPIEQCAVVSGIPETTIRRMAKREQWERRVLTPDERRERARAATTAGNRRMVERWADRREVEADECGADAQVARYYAVMALEDNDPKMAQVAAVVYGILIDKAQLLTGGVTSRFAIGHDDARNAALAAFDELAAKRDRAA